MSVPPPAAGAPHGAAPARDARDDDLAALTALAGRARGQAGAENFPVALKVLPARPRARLLALYDFARFVDDIGDADYEIGGRPVGPADRLRLLDRIDDDLDVPAAGVDPSGGHTDPGGRASGAVTPRVGPVAALDPLRAEGVPVQPFHDLVAANRQDQQVGSYASFDELVAYCRLSADPVGRVVLYVAGAATPKRLAWSDDVCTALQVLEHCQDVAEDGRRHRVYLPQDDLADASERDAVEVNVARARVRLRSGPPLVRSLRGWARVAVAGFVGGGLATADALAAAGYRTTGPTVRPSRLGTARHALRLAAGR